MQTKKHEKRISTLEAQLQQSEAKLNKYERDSKKTTQDVGVKDVRLNRVIEELERYKLMLKDTKDKESGKSEEMREELDKVLEENRKLERQRNELLQAFKKQMKLIDILKKQKMHIEAAKMLSFTEDEFTKLLDV
jgi:chromosome segregation ATPase